MKTYTPNNIFSAKILCAIPVLIFLLFLPGLGSAKSPNSFSHEEVRDLIYKIFSDNAEYVSEISHEHFFSFREQQRPRATVISCSDSRVQSNAFHSSPINDLFMIRNIGNQIITAEGSVEYGIYHLHTPILLIIGHSYCGAIMAAMGDYRTLSRPIRRELDDLHISKGANINQGVLENVNNQVEYALKKFKNEIDNEELIVIGTVYDFRDDFGHGHGRLILVNFNGEIDRHKIKQNEYLKGFNHIPIGSLK